MERKTFTVIDIDKKLDKEGKVEKVILKLEGTDKERLLYCKNLMIQNCKIIMRK